MELKNFFTKQRYIILGAGLLCFILFITLALVIGHNSEFGLLFIDLTGAAVTIMATALVIEYFQYREKLDRTHQVATIAEEEIQAVSYRVKLAIVGLFGYIEDHSAQSRLQSLQDVEGYLHTNADAMDNFYKKGEFTSLTPQALVQFREASERLQHEIESVLSLFDYALPYSLRTNVLALRSSLQISERAMAYIHESSKLSERHKQLVYELVQTVFSSAQRVLEHQSRTADSHSIASKPGRVGKQHQ